MIRSNLESRNPTRTRTVARLGAKLDKNLLAYAAAAGAAGVGMLAVQPAQAKIVYTHANTPIGVDTGAVPLDLNNDGIPDFKFYNSYTTEAIRAKVIKKDEGYHQGALAVEPAQQNNAIWEVTSQGQPCAAALPKRKRVGVKAPFSAKSLVMAASFGSYTNGGSAFGPWLKVQNAYLGLKFVIHGKMHFGWARINFGGLGATDYITGYAYETIPNKPIITGKTKGPASLGVLAKGAGALETWRSTEVQ
jgi:hypothetical protein